MNGNRQLLADTLARAKRENRAALITYMTAGFPTVDAGIAAVTAMLGSGADIVEVGLPHSDPVIDGPVIEAAASLALRGGTRIADVIRTVREAYQATGKPVLVMSYWNPVYRYGPERFARELAAALGGSLGPLRDYQQEVLLPDGRTILVYYKNLIIDGRMNHRKMARLPVSLPVQSRADVFGRRFEDDRGKQVPARTYNGPTVRHLDGLACLIDDDGRVRILEGNDPNRCPNVRETDDWAQAISYLYADPVTVYLVDNGPQELAGLISDAFPEAASLAADTNQLYHLTELLLGAPETRLYATLRVLQVHLAEKRVGGPDARAVDRAWAMLAGQGVSASGRI